jgi:hypothetical protein
MNSATTTASAARPNESWLFRVGGLAALAIGVAYIVIIALYASVGVQPAGPKPGWTILWERQLPC